MKKNITVLFLLVMAVCGATGAFAQRERDFEVEIEDGKVTITGYTGKGGAVHIPATIGGKPVVGISEYWGEQGFAGRTDITSVSIPAGVTSIGWQAFSGCTGLTSVSIPASVTSIENLAFSGCTGLTSEQNGFKVITLGGAGGRVIITGYTGTAAAVVIPARIQGLPVTNIEGGWYMEIQGAFGNRTDLTSVSIPASVTSIENLTFSGCTGLTSISIPASVTSIGAWAFSGCTGLTSINIPASVTSIADKAFEGCTGLTSEQSGFKVLTLGGAGGRATIIGYMGTAAAVVIPARIQGFPVIRIEDKAFMDRTGLTSVSIPTSVTSIGEAAFVGCTGLTSVSIPAGVTTIGNYAFDGCTDLTSIKIPAGVTSIEMSTFVGCTGLTSVSIPASVTDIERYAFLRCTGLTSINIPASVTYIDKYAFSGCTSLTSIRIGADVSIGSVTFENNFERYYNTNGKKAGLYTFRNGAWSYSER